VTGSLELLDIERRIALFAQAITGAAYEVRATETFTGDDIVVRQDRAMLSSKALYLPAAITTSDDRQTNRRTYRLLSLHQLGYREFGTFEFRLPIAAERCATLADRIGVVEPVRESDFDAFFARFEVPVLAQALFRVIEAHRIDQRMLAAYPGVHGDHQREAAAELRRRIPLVSIDALSGALEAIVRFTLGVAKDDLEAIDLTGCVAPVLELAATVRSIDADVYAAAEAVACIYALLHVRGLIPPAAAATEVAQVMAEQRPAFHGQPPTEWLQREDRLEDWRDDIDGLDAKIATSAIDAEAGSSDASAQRPPDVEVRQLTEERDMLVRRTEMERNSIRIALGHDDKPASHSFLYDEWDCHAQCYLRGWCRLFERRTEPGDAAAAIELLKRIAPHEQRVRRQFQQLPLQAYQRTKRVLDGEELDWDQILDHHTDLRRGASPDERVYQRRDRATRDVAAAFLIDLSASTDDPVVRPEPPLRLGADGKPLADDDDDPFWQPVRVDRNEPPSRRIIDVLRDSIALMARALDSHGDAYGVFGFSGYGRDCVEFYVAKEFGEAFRGASLRALVGMRPRRSTRMGPAIRHATAKLARTGSAMKVLLMLSDGFPQDCDYGPDRSDHEYGVADTARALEESARAGVQTFCLTVDRSGHDYLKRMCPDDRYMVIEDIEALPDALTKVYQKLTA
jgi:nitric oxide reductase NorD protein